VDKHYIIACICEGAAEQAIIELLLEKNALIFEKHHLLDDKVIRVRSASKFEEQYLRKQFGKKIKVFRILDSRRENFKLSKSYKDKVEVINIITAPEIEMLIIHNEDKYEDYKKSGKDPSAYCKHDLRYPDVKSYEFVKGYFSNVNILINAIKQYRSKARILGNEKTLYDLLRKTGNC
jgi:hypothetical protein